MTIQVSTDLDLQSVDHSAHAVYLSDLCERLDLDQLALGAETAALVQSLRDRASALAQELTLPTTRQEEWRFTDLAPLRQIKFAGSAWRQRVLANPDSEAFKNLILPEAVARLVFVNNCYMPELSAIANLPTGLAISSLAGQGGAIAGYLGQQPGAEEVFTTLNTAHLTEAAVIRVQRHQVIESPVHLLFISSPVPASRLVSPRCLVVAEPSSSLTLVEEYLTLGTGTDLINAVTEIWLQENAQVNHTRIQRHSQTDFHIGKTAVSQARDSRYTCHAVSLGGRISRHNLKVHSTGQQTETTLNGLTVAAGEQLADTHSAIGFSQPHCTSHQLHKCIVSDRARGVFNGKVSVPKAAQLTDASQLNRNLLLSPKARIDTKPQLEIVADNVKCSHGATVSQLEAEEVFYLQSRGLDYQSACNLLVEGFAVEMLEQIPSATLRRTLSQLILSQIRTEPA
ncbi:MAG: Fe-S cluster assembly protein SufD [Aphanocapsa sp. GSE-SYN-MK-11-07L]|jgi:Fe-S cluster assembly protein SufD|nr:Fe-S cluster assembly protein SufD [Aphanocapsa sp. GSE-SYN-MK-11-07L]